MFLLYKILFLKGKVLLILFTFVIFKIFYEFHYFYCANVLFLLYKIMFHQDICSSWIIVVKHSRGMHFCSTIKIVWFIIPNVQSTNFYFTWVNFCCSGSAPAAGRGKQAPLLGSRRDGRLERPADGGDEVHGGDWPEAAAAECVRPTVRRLGRPPPLPAVSAKSCWRQWRPDSREQDHKNLQGCVWSPSQDVWISTRRLLVRAVWSISVISGHLSHCCREN